MNRDMQKFTVRKGEYDIDIWECVDYEDGDPPLLKRHWFRAGNGMEADTYPEMLQKLGVPPPHPSNPPTIKELSVGEPAAEILARLSPCGTEGASTQAAAASSPAVSSQKVADGAAASESKPDKPSSAGSGKASSAKPHPPEVWIGDAEDNLNYDDDAELEEAPDPDSTEELEKLSNEQLDAEIRKSSLENGMTEEEFNKLDFEDPETLVGELERVEADLKALDEKQAAGEREDDGIPRCQHIKANGKNCGCYALRRSRFCHFHAQTADGRRKKKQRCHIPVLEDALSLQVAVTHICRGLANETMEPRRAATLLYGLQVATAVLRKKPKKPPKQISEY